MQEFIQSIRRKLRYFYLKGYRKARPILQLIEHRIARIVHYYRTHPKARKRTLIVGPPIIFIVVLLMVVWIETPSNRELRNIQNQVASEVYSADSVLLGRYYTQDRTEVGYDYIAPVVIDALIATEDIRFYEHRGIDFISLGRVLFKSILQQDESSGGGSTITQQLSKNLYPRKQYWMLKHRPDQPLRAWRGSQGTVVAIKGKFASRQEVVQVNVIQVHRIY